MLDYGDGFGYLWIIRMDLSRVLGLLCGGGGGVGYVWWIEGCEGLMWELVGLISLYLWVDVGECGGVMDRW